MVTLPLFALEVVLLVPDRYLGPLATSVAMQRLDAFNTELVVAGATRATFLLGPLVPLFFTALAIAIGARSRVEILRWWGAVLAIAGGVVTAIALALPSAFERRWAEPVGTLPELSPRLVDAGHDVATAVVVAFATVLGFISLIVGVVGIVSLAFAWRLARPAAVAEPLPSPSGGTPTPN